MLGAKQQERQLKATPISHESLEVIITLGVLPVKKAGIFTPIFIQTRKSDHQKPIKRVFQPRDGRLCQLTGNCMDHKLIVGCAQKKALSRSPTGIQRDFGQQGKEVEACHISCKKENPPI